MPPERVFGENARGQILCFGNGSAQAVEKPDEPLRNIEVAFLCRFKNLVVALALLSNLRRHAVKTLRAVLQPGQGHLRNGARDSSVSVFQWMDGHEIKMCQACLDEWLDPRCAVLIPGHEFLHLAFDAFRGWTLEVNFVFPFRARDDFDRTLP